MSDVMCVPVYAEMSYTGPDVGVEDLTFELLHSVWHGLLCQREQVEETGLLALQYESETKQVTISVVLRVPAENALGAPAAIIEDLVENHARSLVIDYIVYGKPEAL